MLGNLRSIAKCMNDSQLFDDSIDHMLSLKKGELSQSSFHDYGVEKARTNLELLKSAGEKNIDSIKKEAELSLEELDKMPTNSKQEMDEFVKNYNLGL
jgi:hypothetical protein